MPLQVTRCSPTAGVLIAAALGLAAAPTCRAQDSTSIALPYQFKPSIYNAVLYAYGKRIDVAQFTYSSEQGILYLNGDVFAPATKRPADPEKLASKDSSLSSIPFYQRMRQSGIPSAQALTRFNSVMDSCMIALLPIMNARDMDLKVRDHGRALLAKEPFSAIFDEDRSFTSDCPRCLYVIGNNLPLRGGMHVLSGQAPANATPASSHQKPDSSFSEQTAIHTVQQLVAYCHMHGTKRKVLIYRGGGAILASGAAAERMITQIEDSTARGEYQPGPLTADIIAELTAKRGG